MGPHFFKCGKRIETREFPPGSSGFNGAALFQVRKDFSETTIIPTFLQLQWGRTFSSAERNSNDPTNEDALRLQWGRTFSSAESSVFEFSVRTSEPRFNGAALFQVRKEITWRSKSLNRIGFNGAALFQVRKGQKRTKSKS